MLFNVVCLMSKVSPENQTCKTEQCQNQTTSTPGETRRNLFPILTISVIMNLALAVTVTGGFYLLYILVACAII